MSDLSLTNTLTGGTTEDVGDVQENFQDVVDWANGNIDGDNLTAAANQALGLNETGTVRRGKSIIATEEGRTNTAYGTLTTPDRVQNIVLPTDGLIRVWFQAMWKESVDAAARAAIFVGSNQQTLAVANVAAPAVIEAQCMMASNTYGPLSSSFFGLHGGPAGTSATAYTGDVTTGQAIGGTYSTTTVGGPVDIFVAAGTYTISVQFKASSGTVTVKNRRLLVATEAFG